MGWIIARRMPHTITCRSRALNQIFVILPVDENGLSVSYEWISSYEIRCKAPLDIRKIVVKELYSGVLYNFLDTT